jgi:transmembrane sensor
MDEDEKRPVIDRRIAMDARDWIVRLTSGDVGAADLERFRAWRDRSPEHERAFERERAFWQQLQMLDARSDGLTRPVIPPPLRRLRLSRRAFLIGGGVAATAAIAAVAVPSLQLRWSADFATAVGDQGQFTLPDGSVAALNTDSAISVGFKPSLRLVTLLKGEAEFRVRDDDSSVFRVTALGGNTDALGTTFSVKALDGMVTVTVSEGRVRVAGPASPYDLEEISAGKVLLAANEQTSYAQGGLPQPTRMVDADAILAWRTGRIIFEGRPFASAIAELGRYVPERIVLATRAHNDVPITAIFSTRQALAAVQALAQTQGLSARRIPGVMLLIS